MKPTNVTYFQIIEKLSNRTSIFPTFHIHYCIHSGGISLNKRFIAIYDGELMYYSKIPPEAQSRPSISHSAVPNSLYSRKI